MKNSKEEKTKEGITEEMMDLITKSLVLVGSVAHTLEDDASMHEEIKRSKKAKKYLEKLKELMSNQEMTHEEEMKMNLQGKTFYEGNVDSQNLLLAEAIIGDVLPKIQKIEGYLEEGRHDAEERIPKVFNELLVLKAEINEARRFYE